MAEKQVPVIYQGGFTGVWWCATRWRLQPDGHIVALQKYDVSIQIDKILAAYEAARCADGSHVHDFKGETTCPACGFAGIELRHDVKVSVPTEERTGVEAGSPKTAAYDAAGGNTGGTGLPADSLHNCPGASGYCEECAPERSPT